MANFGNLFSAPLFSVTYLTGKTFDQDGDEQVEQNVVPESHECDKVKRGPVAGSLHAKKEDDVPILLGQNLQTFGYKHPVLKPIQATKNQLPFKDAIYQIDAHVLGHH